MEILPWSEQLSFVANAESALLSARTPTKLVFGAACSKCGFDAFGEIRPGTPIRSYTTDARYCPACDNETVTIDARDTATQVELAGLQMQNALKAPYALVNIGQTTLCLEVLNE